MTGRGAPEMATRPRLPTGTRGLRVAQIVGASEGAGWAVPICAGLQARGYDVVAVVGAPGGRLMADLRRTGVPVTATPLSFGNRWKAAAYAMRLADATLRLAVILRQLRVDIAHAHHFNAVLLGRLAGAVARVPVRIGMIPGPAHLEAPLTARIDRLTGRLEHRTVASCEYIRMLYRALGVPSCRLARVHYGADADRFDPRLADPARVRQDLGLSADAPLVGQVAYFYPPSQGWHVSPSVRGLGIKGHEDFLAAAQLLHARMPAVRFVLVGRGLSAAGERYRNELQHRCRAAGLDRIVMFVGYRPDIPDVLAALDVAVQCSLTESLGGTIESLLMAVPTVATTAGGLPETVRDGVTGQLVPPRDPPSLAAAIEWALRNRDRARAMALVGRQDMLSRFTMEHTVAHIDALYRELTAERTVGPAGTRGGLGS